MVLCWEKEQVEVFGQAVRVIMERSQDNHVEKGFYIGKRTG